MGFPVSMPFAFGGPALLDAEDLGGELSFERAQVCEAGLALLLGQFADKPRIRAVTCALLDGVQDVEDAVWQLFSERWIDTAVGAQLDGTGEVLDFPRAGRTDVAYRAFLRARTAQLRSSGSWPALVAILREIGVTLAEASYQGSPPASYVVRLTDTLPAEVTGADVFGLLDPADPPGVRLTLVAPVGAIEDTFRLADAADYPVTGTGRGLGDATTPGGEGELAGVHASSVED